MWAYPTVVHNEFLPRHPEAAILHEQTCELTLNIHVPDSHYGEEVNEKTGNHKDAWAAIQQRRLAEEHRNLGGGMADITQDRKITEIRSRHTHTVALWSIVT